MTVEYRPPSLFLRDIVADNIPLGGSPFAEANLRKLIALTRDPDRANRDWATMLLAQQEIDTSELREALLQAARDENVTVRGEAVLGLARRDPALALPLVQAALAEDWVCVPMFEAAEAVAHPSLIERLRDFADGDDFVDRRAQDALAACERAEASS